MSVLGLLGSLIGGGSRVSKSERSESGFQAAQSQVSKSTSTGDATKAKVAGKLALIKTGRASVLNDTATGRKKLLGN